MNKSQARKRGRPKKTSLQGTELKKLTICLYPDQVTTLAVLGQGNVSEGARRLLNIYVTDGGDFRESQCEVELDTAAPTVEV